MVALVVLMAMVVVVMEVVVMVVVITANSIVLVMDQVLSNELVGTPFHQSQLQSSLPDLGFTDCVRAGSCARLA